MGANVISTREIWTGRDGELDEHGFRKYKRIFLVQMDDFKAGPLEVTVTNGVPPNLPKRYVPYIGANGEEDRAATASARAAPRPGETRAAREA